VSGDQDFDWDEGRAEARQASEARSAQRELEQAAAGPSWMIVRGSVTTGPLSPADFLALVKGGLLRASDLVWYPGLGDWSRADEAPRTRAALRGVDASRFSVRHPRLVRALIGLAVIVALTWVGFGFVSFLNSGITRGPDQTFGDQTMKTTIALLELYKVRHGGYPDRLTDIDFVGEWDKVIYANVRYVVSADRQHYYVEVERGWAAKPHLSYPPGFWKGTGYDPALGNGP
jgi:hypothetical protein